MHLQKNSSSQIRCWIKETKSVGLLCFIYPLVLQWMLNVWDREKIMTAKMLLYSSILKIPWIDSNTGIFRELTTGKTLLWTRNIQIKFFGHMRKQVLENLNLTWKIRTRNIGEGSEPLTWRACVDEWQNGIPCQLGVNVLQRRHVFVIGGDPWCLRTESWLLRSWWLGK